MEFISLDDGDDGEYVSVDVGEISEIFVTRDTFFVEMEAFDGL